MIADFHLHSNFSGDCQIPMEEMIERAIELKIQQLCFTEHHDLDYPHPTIDFTLNLDAYIQKITKMREAYKDSIQILIGIELGMQPHLHNTLKDIVDTYPFDFVLASNHLARGIDPYDRIYFENRSQYKGYLNYFEAILENVSQYSDFDTYGHLDYVIRYGDFPEKRLAYKDFSDVLDQILRFLIQNGRGVEVNTAGYRYNLGHPHPSPEILKHYLDLGGEIITIGSDAHHPKHLINNLDNAKDLLSSIGFKYFTTFVERKPYFHKL